VQPDRGLRRACRRSVARGFVAHLGLSLALASLASGPAGAAPAPSAGQVRLLPTPVSLFADKLRHAAATTPAGSFPVEARPGATAWTTAGAWHWAAGFVPTLLFWALAVGCVSRRRRARGTEA
jgi:hypothetical protein